MAWVTYPPPFEPFLSGGFLRSAGACRAYHSSVLGHRSIVLENRYLRVTVLPERGGALFELLWKPADIDLLWRWERGLRPVGYVPSLALSQGNYQDHFFGGWDIMCPTVDQFQPVAPLPIGYHGEVASLPWRSTITTDEPDEVTVELTVRCIRAPFVVTRVLRLTRLPQLVIETTIENVSKCAVKYAVGEHIALNVGPILPGRLQLAAATLTTPDGELCRNARLAPGQESEWPGALLADGHRVDVSHIDAGTLGTSDVIGLVDLGEPTIRIVPTEGPLPPFSLTWEAALMPSLLLWLGLGGDVHAPWFGTATLLAVEPMSLLPWADPAQLPKAEPGEVIFSRLRMTIGDVTKGAG